jgi:Fe-S-cluster containining protein
MTKERFSCSCTDCAAACKQKPGWLKFGDEKAIAAHLGISVKELFDNYLLVDWWQDKGKDYFGLSPCVTRLSPGVMFSYNPKGTCVFLKDGLCGIHAVAPFECQQLTHESENMVNHRAAAQSWDCEEAKELIRELLGHEPYQPEMESFSEMFGMF